MPTSFEATLQFAPVIASGIWAFLQTAFTEYNQVVTSAAAIFSVIVLFYIIKRVYWVVFWTLISAAGWLFIFFQFQSFLLSEEFAILSFKAREAWDVCSAVLAGAHHTNPLRPNDL